MNEALERLASRLALSEPANERLRLEFGYACALRVKHFIEDPAVADCLFGLGQFLSGSVGEAHLRDLAARAARFAS